VRDRVPKAIVAVVAVVAVVRAATASGPAPGHPLSDEQAHAVYRDLASRERGMRREAAVAFPGDLWSQDDDFHRRENDTARDFASHKEVRLDDVVRAVDDGMKQRWPAPSRPVATVPPCRPRLSY